MRHGGLKPRATRFTLGFTLALPLGLACLAGCGSDQPGSGDSDRSDPVNLLWISLDTLRADRLSCYGNERATSPHIDALAEGGLLFERAVATSSWTLPSHVSMLTGLPISAHGVCYHDYGKRPSPLRGQFISELLQERGYATAGYWAHAYVDHAASGGAGFDTWERTGSAYRQIEAIREQWEAAQAAGDRDETRRLVKLYNEAFRDAERFEADDGVNRAVAWLDGHLESPSDAERPFFLFLHVFDIHSPYSAPEPFYDRFDPEYEGELESVNVDAPERPVRPGMDPRDLEHVLSLYDGEIAWVDAQIGRLLEALEARGLTDDTLVILTSDHGEEFLEHGESGHHKHLYRESLQVPMILRLPGTLTAGRRVHQPVSVVDLVPTVAGLLGLDPPEGLPGVDLSSLGDEPLGRTLVGELTIVPDGAPIERALSLYSDREHVIVRDLGTAGQRAERFDLAANPEERGFGTPLAPGAPGWTELEQRVERIRAELAALRDDLPARGEVLELSALEQAELEALGYTGFETEAGEDEGRLCLDGCVFGPR